MVAILCSFFNEQILSTLSKSSRVSDIVLNGGLQPLDHAFETLGLQYYYYLSKMIELEQTWKKLPKYKDNNPKLEEISIK